MTDPHFLQILKKEKEKNQAEFFKIDHKTNRAYEFSDYIQFMLRYEMDLSMTQIDRVIYGTF